MRLELLWSDVTAVTAATRLAGGVLAAPVERYRAILDWTLAGQPGGLGPSPADDAAAGATRPGSP